MPVQTLKWQNDGLNLLDQTRLPTEVVNITCRDVEAVAEAIEQLRVRGAPAIGVSAAYGVVIGAQLAVSAQPEAFRKEVEAAIDRLGRTRPTAVNLFWALERMRRTLDKNRDSDNQTAFHRLREAADEIFEHDRAVCRQLGQHGASLLRDGDKVITHCNAGGLATADYGTALGVVYAAQEQEKRVTVFADETRPLLQGSRLTAWELMQNGVDVRLICDNMAATVMRQEKISCIIVGADRIAGNGDVANKIGTYGLAIIAKEHEIPFYVAAPMSTVDMALASGDLIPIEERQPAEISDGFGKRTAPAGVQVFNPAFDVTPNEMVTAIITEKGIARQPYEPTLRDWSTGEETDAAS